MILTNKGQPALLEWLIQSKSREKLYFLENVKHLSLIDDETDVIDNVFGQEKDNFVSEILEMLIAILSKLTDDEKEIKNIFAAAEHILNQNSNLTSYGVMYGFINLSLCLKEDENENFFAMCMVIFSTFIAYLIGYYDFVEHAPGA